MAEYRVIFFNNLLNSYGMPFKCLQRAIAVTAEDAAEAAKLNISTFHVSVIGL